MMTEISLNILDIAQNSIAAEAALIDIEIAVDTEADLLIVRITDDGKGMDEEQLKAVSDPFFTTRTTRKVGLGIPFFAMAAESTGGHMVIHSEKGKGTEIEAVFKLSHIDRMPLGDINSTIYTLVAFNTSIDFVFTYMYNGKSFILNTREFKEILDGVALDTPEVLKYLKQYLHENKSEVDGDMML